MSFREWCWSYHGVRFWIQCNGHGCGYGPPECSTGDGGPLTEVTDGNQRMNCGSFCSHEDNSRRIVCFYDAATLFEDFCWLGWSYYFNNLDIVFVLYDKILIPMQVLFLCIVMLMSTYMFVNFKRPDLIKICDRLLWCCFAAVWRCLCFIPVTSGVSMNNLYWPHSFCTDIYLTASRKGQILFIITDMTLLFN